MSRLRVRPKAAHGLVTEVTPKSAGWGYVGFALHRLGPGESLEAETGCARGLPRARLRQGEARGRRQGFRRDRRAHEPVRGAAVGRLHSGRRPLSRRGVDAARARRLLRAGRRRASSGEAHPAGDPSADRARKGLQHPPRHQHHARGRRLGRFAARGRGDHARRQHLVLPAAQARPGRPAERELPRGDLLSPLQPAAGLRLPARLHRRPLARRIRARSRTATS